MPEPKKGATTGRVRGTAIPGTRVFYKPAMGKVIFRPTNVVRSSDKVIEINKQLLSLRGSPEHPAKVCKGLPWKEFVRCMSEQMKKKIHKVT